MATALQGSVIIDTNGNNVKWRKKCEKCGDVDSGTNNSMILPHTKKTGTFVCRKCKANNQFVIQG